MDKTLKLILLHHRQGAKYGDTKQALLDLFSVSNSLPTYDEMDKERNLGLQWYEDNRTEEQISLDYRKGWSKGFSDGHKWTTKGNDY